MKPRASEQARRSALTGRVAAALAATAAVWWVAPQAGQALAQAAPEGAASAAEDEAMARARRQARSPFRWILEASKIKREPRAQAPAAGARGPAAQEAGPAPEVATAPGTAVRERAGAQAAARPPAAGADAASPEQAQAPRTAGLPRVSSEAGRGAEPPAELAPQAAAPVAAAGAGAEPSTPEGHAKGGLGPAEAAPGTGGAVAAATESAGSVAGAELAAESRPAATEPAQPPERALVSLVEPVVPQRLLREVAPGTAVDAELEVRPDGSVDKVRVSSFLPRGLRRAVEDALLQWRYEHAASPSVQRVQMVVNPDG